MRQIKLILILVVLLFLCACAGWRGNTVTSYETGGKTLNLYKAQAQKACDQKLVTPDNCAKLKASYNAAYKPFILAGDALAAAIETDDTIQQDTWKIQYQVLIETYTRILLQFIEMGYDLGIFSKGGQL